MITTRPMLLKPNMCNAVEDGSKTQTRRIMKKFPPKDAWMVEYHGDWERTEELRNKVGWLKPCNNDKNCCLSNDEEMIPCPYGKVGDILWVRQTFWHFGKYVFTGRETKKNKRAAMRFEPGEYIDGGQVLFNEPPEIYLARKRFHTGYHKRPSIFMPKKYATLFLEITGIRVERLQDISGADAINEGLLKAPKRSNPLISGWAWETGPPRIWYPNPVWAFASLWDSINKDRGYGWDVNPWVWVIVFKKTERPENFI